jgi:hypothetical protein
VANSVRDGASAINRNREQQREQILNNINHLIVVRGRREGGGAVGVVAEGNNNNNNVVQRIQMADGREHRGGGGAAGGGRADVNGNAAGNSAGYSGGGSNQRECLTYGTESVESWASTEASHNYSCYLSSPLNQIEKSFFVKTECLFRIEQVEQETFSFLWRVKGYSSYGGSEEIKSPVFRGGPKSLHFW